MSSNVAIRTAIGQHHQGIKMLKKMEVSTELETALAELQEILPELGASVD